MTRAANGGTGEWRVATWRAARSGTRAEGKDRRSGQPLQLPQFLVLRKHGDLERWFV
ncbi:hypothetical protein BS78_04G244400 [Paspalum vaginatum]|nr:hypothetical protein BS78_04G244400 [Paspalum vaginatum]